MQKKSFTLIFLNLIIQILMMVVITGASAMRSSTNNTVPVVPKEVTSENGTQPQNKLSTKDAPHMGREHVIDKIYMNTSVGPKIIVKTNKSENVSTTLATSPIHGIQKPLNASEELKVVATKMNSTVIGEKVVNSTTKGNSINSTTVIQKVNSTSSTTTNSVSSTNITKSTTVKPRKPTITEHDDVAIVEKLVSHSPNIPGIDTTFEKKTNRADYVVPIVAVILSIPLVTIIFSVLLKRGKDWWQHRNYRRMDYLIEGLYNS